MTRHVRGSLFIDSIRMVRARKDVNWSKALGPVDLELLEKDIELETWHPMETFERVGLAILKGIAGGNLAAVKQLGRASIDALWAMHPELVSPGDTRETLMKFHVLRTGLFDFPALTVSEINDAEASVEIRYQMSKPAEEAAAYQTLGHFERLLELSNAKAPHVSFASRSWAGDEVTRVAMGWG